MDAKETEEKLVEAAQTHLDAVREEDASIVEAAVEAPLENSDGEIHIQVITRLVHTDELEGETKKEDTRSA